MINGPMESLSVLSVQVYAFIISVFNSLAYFDKTFPSRRRPLEYLEGSLPSNNTEFSSVDFS